MKSRIMKSKLDNERQENAGRWKVKDDRVFRVEVPEVCREYLLEEVG